MRTAVLLPAIALATMAHAQIVQSGFENWTSGLPDGWYGVASNIPAANVAQVTDNVHGGTSAVRLTNTTSTHARFSSQAQSLTAYDVYQVTFWLRGGGDVRTGISDGRAEDFGYNYNAYVTAGATWTEVTQYVTCLNTTSAGEFIFSVRNTTGENIVLDDVTITQVYSLATVMPIQDIQDDGGSPDGASVYAGKPVRFNGIVTAVDLLDNNNAPILTYWIQDATGPWNGIIVVDYATETEHMVAIGDRVELVGTVTEFHGLTEIYGASIQRFTLVASGQTVPAPLVIPTSDLSNEAIESVLVRIEDANCIDPPSGANYGNWGADDGSGEARIGHMIFRTTPDPVINTHYNVTGVVSFDFDVYRIEPRMNSDVELATGIDEAGVLSSSSLFPNPATDMVTLDLGAAAGQRVGYTVSDAQGRIIRNGQVSDLRSTLSVADLAAGSYNLTLVTSQFRKNIVLSVVR